jgi:hypothetical protein
MPVSNRDAQRALDSSRTKLKAAAREVDAVIDKVASGDWFLYSAAEGALRSDRSTKAEYQMLATALQTCKADLAVALNATEALAVKLTAGR